MTRFLLQFLLATFGFITACTGGFFIWVAVNTGDSAAEAEGFLNLMLQGETSQAYSSTAAQFRAEQDQETFEKTLDRMGLRNYVLESWRNRRLERGDEVEYRGTLQQLGSYDDPLELPFKVGLVQEGGEWKVRYFTGPGRVFRFDGDVNFASMTSSGIPRGSIVGPGAWFSQVPDEEELLGMTRQTLLAFDQAVKDGDFAEFYEKMSRAFKVEIHVKDLQATYQSFIDGQVDLSSVANVEPQWDQPPSIERSRDFGDVIKVSGFFPIEPATVPFMLRFHYEYPEWRLYKFLVSLPGVSPLTPE